MQPQDLEHRRPSASRGSVDTEDNQMDIDHSSSPSSAQSSPRHSHAEEHDATAAAADAVTAAVAVATASETPHRQQDQDSKPEQSQGSHENDCQATDEPNPTSAEPPAFSAVNNTTKTTDHPSNSDASTEASEQIGAGEAAEQSTTAESETTTENNTDYNAGLIKTENSSSQPPEPSRPAPQRTDPPRPAGVQQALGAKRKRVYSNRTKTGCLTCRRRKKKCDEERPACNNCVRGGFFCEGYTTGRTWQKSATPSSTPTGAHTTVFPSSHLRTSASPGRESPSRRRSTTPQPRNGVHPHLQTVYTPVAEESPLRREIRTPSTTAVSPKAQRFHHPPPGYVDPNGYPAAQARLALNMEPHVAAGVELQQRQQAQAGSRASEKSEKVKMINGEPFRPHDAQLVRDREICQASICRWTSSRNPLNGLSHEERARLLRYVFQSPAHMPESLAQSSNTASHPPTSSRPTSSVAAAVSANDQLRTRTPPPSYIFHPANGAPPLLHPTGAIGIGSTIDPPFNCHYGYNIQIGADVHISENCLFSDDCQITIGSHTWIGPGLTIITSTALPAFSERKGSQSRYQGRSVVIEDHCWIAPNVTIMPGVHIGKGACVEAGQMVTTSIPAYACQGAPAPA